MIDRELEEITHQDRLANKGRVSERVWDDAVRAPIDSFPLNGGKQIRAGMIHSAFRMAGGIGEPPIELLSSIEWLHAGSLVIDDIEDGSEQRRGAPCMHRTYGVPIALNAGNWMYFQALELLAALGRKTRYGNRLLETTIRVVKTCHEGQALDLATRVDLQSRRDVYAIALTISKLKTGGLTGLAARAGAVAADADPRTCNAITRFGVHVGICLQMHNDLSELAHVTRCGIPKDDLRNARVSWPWAWAARLMSAKDFRSLQSRYGRALSNRQSLLPIAEELYSVSAKHGWAVIVAKLEKHLQLLSEHVESVELIHDMELALAPLKTGADASAR